MLSAEKIRRLFSALNDELAKKEIIGEIGLCGGAVMCLVFQTRKATKDVDAIFEPARQIREAAKAISGDFDVPEDWLNDAAKGFFFSEPPRVPVLNLSHLRVWAPGPDYMLAMKCFSARFDTHDRDDVTFLIQHLKLTKSKQVFDIIKKYCPERLVPAKTRFLVEELLPGQ
ncbi:MAG TPA: DUF6036 family nucleotidyltransferase [Planctomycetota bacterium]|nr:DUF6036 family nucleotidyltransferase [Planctomycetota bacterium]